MDSSKASAYVRECMSKIPSFELCPVRFFMAWNGVLVLAFSGFPKQIENAKCELNDKLFDYIGRENFGSKWPKITLGAINDLGCCKHNTTFSEFDFMSVWKICKSFTHRLESMSMRVNVSTLSAVTMHCRSLERIHHRVDIGLSVAPAQIDISESQLNLVSNIFDDAECDLSNYYYTYISALKSSLANHYRCNHTENTLVAFMHDNTFPASLRQLMIEFRREIDSVLPQKYVWFDDEALHCTIRCLKMLKISNELSIS